MTKYIIKISILIEKLQFFKYFQSLIILSIFMYLFLSISCITFHYYELFSVLLVVNEIL
jgi:hypothetical protein